MGLCGCVDFQKPNIELIKFQFALIFDRLGMKPAILREGIFNDLIRYAMIFDIKKTNSGTGVP